MNILKKIAPFIVVTGLSYWAVAPLFISGLFPIHDNTQVERVFEMHRSLADGMFPVRWVADLGYNYGYPIFNFYAPLAYYFGALFMLLGFDALAATKLMMLFGIVFAGVSMYFLAREFWGKIGGILAGVTYVYAPYHALQLYVRGDVAEFWAYAFIPLAFWGVYKVFKSPQPPLRKGGAEGGGFWLWVVIGSLGYAGIILSHNLTAMMVTPFLFSFGFFLLFFSKHKNPPSPLYIKGVSRRTGDFIWLFSPLFLGILLASFYWLPTLTEMKYTNVLSVVGGGSDYKDHFVCPIQLWDSPWGFAGSTSGCVDGMSFKVGKMHVLLVILSLIALGFPFKKKRIDLKIPLFFVIALLVAVLFTLDASKFVWDAIPQMAFFQFPWRFLILVSFFASFIIGSLIWIVNSKFQNNLLTLLISGLVICVVIFVNAKVFNPSTINNVTADNFVSKTMLSWQTSKISDEYMPPGFREPEGENEVPDKKIIADGAVVSAIQEKTQKVEATIEAPTTTQIVFSIAYFPAWQMYVDGKKVPYEKSDKGLLVEIPAGKHMVTAVFEQTPIEKFANFLSITGVLILVLGIIIRRNNQYDKKGT